MFQSANYATLEVQSMNIEPEGGFATRPWKQVSHPKGTADSGTALKVSVWVVS